MTDLSSFLILAQDAEMRTERSLLTWMLEALGLFYGVLLPLAGLAVFVGACLVVAMNRRPSVIAAYLVFVPLPFLIGIFGTFDGFIRSFSVIAQANGTPGIVPISQGISTGLFTSLIGMLVMFPSYFVVAIGLFLRTVGWGDEGK
ncbi:MAG: MotA/TolQ/ExbB proton channel family protein [Pirellulaceae bacterium]